MRVLRGMISAIWLCVCGGKDYFIVIYCSVKLL